MTDLREIVAPWVSASTFDVEMWPDRAATFNEWEAEADAKLQEIPRLAGAICRGGHKTSYQVRRAIWFTVIHDESLVAVVVPTYIEAGMFWREFRVRFVGSRVEALFPGGQLLTDAFRDERGVQRIVTISAESRATEGRHSKAVAILYDEAKNIPDSIFESSLGYLSGAGETLQIALSTAGAREHWFAKRWQSVNWGTLIKTIDDIPALASVRPLLADELDENSEFSRRNIYRSSTTTPGARNPSLRFRC